MVHIRTITNDDIEGVANLTARAFGQDDVARMQRELTAALHHCPFMPKDLCWIAEEDGRVLAKWQFLDFVVRVAGVELRAAGAMAVVAEPDQHGRGPARDIIPVAFAGVIAAGFDLGFGFAQHANFYKRYVPGATSVMANYTLRIERRRIPRFQKLQNDPFSTFVPYSEADIEPMFAHYERSNADRSGSMVRSVKHWGWMPRRPTNIVMAKDGYIGYRVTPDAIEIREIGGDSVEFYDMALRKLGALAREAGVNEVRGPVPIDHPFAQVCASYGASIEVEYPAHSGALFLAANVESFITKLAPAFERRLRESRFSDRHVQFSLRCDDILIDLNLNPTGQFDTKLELAVSRGALMWLTFGTFSVGTVLAREGIARHTFDDEAFGLLEIIFPVGHPFMWEPDRF